MSIKKELLYELDELQLKKLADIKGIKFDLNKIKKQYYDDWNEKDKLVDIMTDHQGLSVSDIEKFIMDAKEDARSSTF